MQYGGMLSLGSKLSPKVLNWVLNRKHSRWMFTLLG